MDAGVDVDEAVGPPADDRPADDVRRDDEGRPVVDALGMPCPRPVIELAGAVARLEVGQEVRLLADDPAARVDVPVWCRMQRQQLVSQEEQGTTLSFVVRKTREL